MSKRIFSADQITVLLANKNVLRCSSKSITYTTAFKVGAVKLYEEGLTSTEVFKQAGFDLNLIGREQPKECLRRWRKVYKKKGKEGLVEVRGRNSLGKPKAQKRSKDAQMKWLEAEVKYLRAENDFLVKLRAKKVE